MRYFSKPSFEKDEYIEKLKTEFNNYSKLFSDISRAQLGKYTPHQIIQYSEDFIKLLEENYDKIKNWAENYLNKYRDRLWLSYGLSEGCEYVDYWKIRDTDYSELSREWPFLYQRSNPNYKDFVINLRGAQSEIVRQRKRQDQENPNYVPYHPDGCPKGCCCWMLDSTEQWEKEEREEIKASRNIFFNSSLISEFYKVALEDLPNLKDEWENWVPKRKESKVVSNEIKITPGETILKIVINWNKNDYYYSNIVSLFDYSDYFSRVWENIDFIPKFISDRKEKLKKMRDLL